MKHLVANGLTPIGLDSEQARYLMTFSNKYLSKSLEDITMMISFFGLIRNNHYENNAIKKHK